MDYSPFGGLKISTCKRQVQYVSYTDYTPQYLCWISQLYVLVQSNSQLQSAFYLLLWYSPGWWPFPQDQWLPRPRLLCSIAVPCFAPATCKQSKHWLNDYIILFIPATTAIYSLLSILSITATSSIRHPTALRRTASPAQLLLYGRRAFCVAGPSVWNSLPDSLQNPIIGGNSFRQYLKMSLFATYWCIQRI